MPALALVLALPLLALAQSAGVEALKGRFSPQEQILLSGLLASPQTAQEFARDGAGDQAAFETKWRARLAQFSTDYMSRPHPLNEKAHSLKEAVEPAQWAMLMATMRALKNSSSWTDQAKLKIFLNMIENADDGLKAGDASDAHKVESTANPKLTEAMQEYLATPAAKKAVADQARADQEAKERVAREQAARDQAAREQAERDRLAREQQPPKEQPAKTPGKTPVAKTPPPVKVPPAKDDAAERERTAREQLEAAERARGNTGTVVDGSNGQGTPVAEAPPVQAIPAAGGGGQVPTLTLPSASVPAARAGVPSPSVSQDDDMAELRSMKKEAQGKTGWRKWGAGGAGLVLGGLLGLLLGGPIGAAVGAALLGGGAFLGARYLWG